jgi:ankyrin repeat protein
MPRRHRSVVARLRDWSGDDTSRCKHVGERSKTNETKSSYFEKSKASRSVICDHTTTTRARTEPSAMVVDAPRGVETRARKRRRNFDAQAGVVIPGLPFEVVVTHVLREENLPDPADLAVLRGASRGMRDAVDATGRRIEELGEVTAAALGCLTTLRCLLRRGLLEYEEHLCQAAARSGQLDELKALRVENCQWDEETCAGAAEGGHLEVLQWARANGCPWDAKMFAAAAEGGHLAVVLALIDEAGLDFNKTTDDDAPLGMTPLFHAAREGHEALVRALTKAGVDVNKAETNGLTPLYIAAGTGHEVVVWVLIEAGADVNKARDDGVTPLFMASLDGNETVVQALIVAGADVNKAADGGTTPLHIAAEIGHEPVVQMLRDAGAV